MAKNKTAETSNDVIAFIKQYALPAQQEDSFRLIEIMREVSGHEPKMWGPTIVGFGTYHYKYDSGHEGDAPLLGFSPRKAAISLYVFTGSDHHQHLLEGLGKFKMGKACIYVKKLSDIDESRLRTLMQETMAFLKTKYSSE